MKQALIKLAKYMMIPAGALWSLFNPPARVRILMYHRVCDGVEKELSVKLSDFRWQMEYLRRRGWRVVTLDEAVRGRPGRGKLAVLTFDDGYEDFYENAYPVLREYGYPSIVYVVPGRVESGQPFWWDGDIGKSPLMDWAQIRELQAGGIVQFGSHTMTHADLDRLGREGIYRELAQSREALGCRLRAPVRHFAYPRGIVTKCASDAARELYETAVTIFEGNDIAPDGGCDKAKLKRLPVQRSDGKGLFAPRLMGWLAPEGWLKLALGRH